MKKNIFKLYYYNLFLFVILAYSIMTTLFSDRKRLRPHIDTTFKGCNVAWTTKGNVDKRCKAYKDNLVDVYGYIKQSCPAYKENLIGADSFIKERRNMKLSKTKKRTTSPVIFSHIEKKQKSSFEKKLELFDYLKDKHSKLISENQTLEDELKEFELDQKIIDLKEKIREDLLKKEKLIKKKQTLFKKKLFVLNKKPLANKDLDIENITFGMAKMEICE